MVWKMTDKTIKQRFNPLLGAMAQGKPTQKLSPKALTVTLGKKSFCAPFPNYAMNPRLFVAKLPRFGKSSGRLDSDTPNHRARVEAY